MPPGPVAVRNNTRQDKRHERRHTMRRHGRGRPRRSDAHGSRARHAISRAGLTPHDNTMPSSGDTQNHIRYSVHVESPQEPRTGFVSLSCALSPASPRLSLIHDRGDAHIHKTPCTNTHAHTHTQLQLLALHLLDCTKSPCSGALMLTAVAPSSSLWPKRAPKCQRVK